MTEPWRRPRQLSDFEPLKPAEQKLLDERDTGLIVRIGDGTLPPEDAPDEVRVRASFLRWLILGAEGVEGQTHEKGVRVEGAFIESVGSDEADTTGLDLAGCEVGWDIALVACRFEAAPLLRRARLQGLFLNRSHLPGLNANGLAVTSGAFLRGIQSEGKIRLRDARIGGSLDFAGAPLRMAGGNTQNADGLPTTGDVFLRGIESDGAVWPLDARFGGSLDGISAKSRKPDGHALTLDRLATTGSVLLSHGFESEGTIWLNGARIGGDLVCSDATLRKADGDALVASKARIEGTLFLLPAEPVAGAIDLRAARLGPIQDDPARWSETVWLDRCTYTAFINCPVDAETRIAWLARDDDGTEFRPQPWEQCAKVLRETGHAADARAVLIEKERRQRRTRRKSKPWWWGWPLWLGDGLLGLTVRYGRQPMLAFAWLLGFWIAGIGFFGGAAAVDAIKPNNAFVLRAPEWVLCGVEAPQRVFLPSLRRMATGRAEAGESQRACFEGEREAAQYPAFDPFVYSLDTLLPVVDMEMQAFWIPDESAAHGWGALARVYLWVHIFVGWALSLLAVAGFSGLVKSD